MPSLKNLFLLDPEIIFLNHGSFGACPKPVFAAYQDWQKRLERQPVLFLGREFFALDREARQALGGYLHAEADDLAFVPNATHGVNIVGRALQLGPGDEVLTSDHEYGACDNTWDFICRKTGAKIVRRHIPLPVPPTEAVLELIWQGVTSRTRLIYLSHITSGSALRLPIEALCARARRAGILTLIDGAHAPGQIPLDLPAVGADFYTGNCHKWMMAPKGAAFLYTRRAVQSLIEPLVVSWGYSPSPEFTSGSPYVDLLEWTGTRDPSAAYTVPAAISFMQEQHWDQVREACSRLLGEALDRVCELTGIAPVYLPEPDYPAAEAGRPGGLPGARPPQMAVAPMPPETDLAALKERLYAEFRVEVPVTEWQGQKFIRISVQGYNTPEDINALVSAIKVLLPQVKSE